MGISSPGEAMGDFSDQGTIRQIPDVGFNSAEREELLQVEVHREGRGAGAGGNTAAAEMVRVKWERGQERGRGDLGWSWSGFGSYHEG